MVVDASVAVSRLVQENASHHARALFRYCENDRRLIAVPPHFPGEVTNALYQKQRTNDPHFHLEPAEVDVAVVEFSQLIRRGIAVVAHPELYPRAVALARAHGLPTVYDTLYLALAELLRMELWTNDRRLLDAVGQAISWVRPIREFPLN